MPVLALSPEPTVLDPAADRPEGALRPPGGRAGASGARPGPA
jgi:hypothetical protein